MRILLTTVAVLALTFPLASAAPEDGAGGAGKAGKGKDQVRAKILKRFDENGNGKLDPAEKEKLKKWREAKGRGKAKGKKGPGAGKTGRPERKKSGEPPKGGQGGTPPLRGGKTGRPA